MKICCVDDCTVTADDDVMYFEFPTSRLLRKRWLDAIGSQHKLLADARVCIRHFTRADYEDVRGKTRLKGKVVPSVFGRQTNENHASVPEQNNVEQTEKSQENTTHEETEKIQNHSKNNEILNNKSNNGNLHNDNENLENDNQNNHNDKGKSRKTRYSKRNKEKMGKLNGNGKCNGNGKASNMGINSAINNDISYKTGSTSNVPDSSQDIARNQIDTSKQDIEDIITNYQIENKKTERQVAAMSDRPPPPAPDQPPAAHVDITDGDDAPPVYIELSVGQDGQEQTASDCLMVLESVQVDVDPSYLLDNDDRGKATSISLLTSSDSDDVILEEPHVDTVEVSDADSDDVPLVSLAPRPLPAARAPRARPRPRPARRDRVLTVCSECVFTTSSRSQMYRHRRQHRNEKRYKCILCNYKARHSMSLIYHMKTHEASELFRCENCSYKCENQFELDSHVKTCSLIICDVQRLSCDECKYSTKRRSDLKRHKTLIHGKSRE